MPISVMINSGRLHHSNPDEALFSTLKVILNFTTYNMPFVLAACIFHQVHLILHLIPIVSPPLSPSALHELRCPSDLERILPNPPSGATPSLCGWSTGRSLLVWCCSGHDKGTKRFQGQRFKTKGREEPGAWLPVRYLIRGSSPETVGYVGVEAEDLNGPLDAEMMENAAHLQRQQVLLGNSKRVFTKSGRLSNDLFRENLQSEYKRIIRKNFCHKSLSL